jgi:hypothetical protein
MNISAKNTRPFSFITGIILFLVTTNVSATQITFVDKVNPGPDHQLIAFGNNRTYSFTHSIIVDQDGAGTFWSGNYGYNPLTDQISSASLVLRFKDESDDIAPESVSFIFDNQSFGTQTITSGGEIFAATFFNNVLNLNALLNDGILNVTLENAGITNGPQDNRSDFLFIDSTLTVEVERGVQSAQQVPEPATLALISLCLVGLVYSRRKEHDQLNRAYSEIRRSLLLNQVKIPL